ncbi:amidohydrolase, partial [Klebsiella pneumoniae]
FRDKQLAGLADKSRRPLTTNLGITDDEIRSSVEGAQLRLQKERGTDVTIFSPRAAGMAHHVGKEATSREWTTICND